MAGKKATEFDARLGVRLRGLRMGANATQRAVAAELGMSAAQLQKYENGTNAMSARDVQIAARFLQVPVMAFYDPPGSDADGMIEGIAPDQAARIRELIGTVAELLVPPAQKVAEPLPDTALSSEAA